mmetsp:Transcript_127877/g.272710  ORF Transcript_127877/g.272710 Transcript_127877/m.272710 type:complete len:319 (-) Transcript_127877:1280-2236(-)
MRVGQLRLQEELELWVVVHLLTADLDDHGRAPPLDHGSSKHRLKDCIDFCSHSLDEELATHLDGKDHLLEPIGHGELESGEVLPEALLDPLHTLKLRVDHEGPSRAASQHGGILHRDAIRGQTLILPIRDVRLCGENVQRINLRRDRDAPIREVLCPSLLPELLTQLHGERRSVAHKCRGQEAVANKFHLEVLEVGHSLRPPLVLIGEATDQSLCEAELLEAPGSLLLHSLLLGDGTTQLLVQPRTLLLDVRHSLLYNGQRSLRAILRRCGLRHLLHQRRHLHIDLVVLDAIDHPVGKVRSGLALAGHGLVVEEGQGD